MAIPRNLANIAPHVNASSTELVVNDGGANLDFRVEGDTDANLLFVDAGNERVGVGTSTPASAFEVQKTGVQIGGDYYKIGDFTQSSASTKGVSLGYDNANAVGIIAPYGTNSLAFWTFTSGAWGERARITSGGYFKASNNGTYNGSTDSYHELRQTTNNATFVQTSTDASLASVIDAIKATRSATSSYIFLRCESNAGSDIEFDLKGDGNGYADGTWNNNGADYAEFFESANGQALTLGATVVLDGNKVREATDQDPASSVIGVVRPKEPSKASMVIGNTAWNKWANKYLTDDFDRYIMEDHDVVEWKETVTDEEGNTSTKQHSYESQAIPAGITVPDDATRKTHDDKGNKFQHYKLNPAWNPDSEYVNRENRPEWNIIGLLGQVKILKGQPVGDRWLKMRDVSETVEEWFIR